MTEPVLRIENLNVSFGPLRVVRDVSLDLAPSEKLAIIGESGSGKSITAMSVMRLIDDKARITGRIQLAGTDVLAASDRQMQALRGSRVAMVFQDPATSLNPSVSIGSQLRDVLKAHRITAPDRYRERSLELLAQVGLPDPEQCLGLFSHQLSGGMRQRVMIALAVACDPEVLIADEPTTALDVTVQEQIVRLLVSLCDERRIGLIFISHNLDLVGEFADRIAVMRRGEIIECGPACEVMGAPKAEYTRQLLASIPRATARPEQAGEQVGEAVLEVRGVSRSYPVARSAFQRLFDKRRSPALHPCDLTVNRHEVLGIIGESGSGKTTLARILIGLQTPDSGSVRLKGSELRCTTRAERVELSRTMQLVFQGSHTSLNPRKSIRQALVEASRTSQVSSPRPPEELMDLVRLDRSLLARYPHQLSGGQRQRVGIARALGNRPEILIADEPTSALDVSIQKEIIDLLRSLHRDLGMTMVIISHDLGLVGSICNRVVVVRSGQIVEQGPASQVLSEPTSDYTRLLIEATPKGLEGRARYRHADVSA